MTGTVSSSMLSIYSGRQCIGFLLKRNKAVVEAFDADCISLGIFPTEHEAADAVTAAPGAVAVNASSHPENGKALTNERR